MTFRIAEGGRETVNSSQPWFHAAGGPFMSLTTLNDIFFTVVERNLERVMLHRQAGRWLPISSNDLRRNVAGTARALHDWGIRKGDRVAILSENRPEWPTADMAILLLGAVTVPVYSTLTADQTAYTIADSGARVIFVSTELQLRKVQSILPQTQVE
ncbi:MAG: AMP-binding protein, partial [Candidatus Sulfotelmatobacter sp.]